MTEAWHSRVNIELAYIVDPRSTYFDNNTCDSPITHVIDVCAAMATTENPAYDPLTSLRQSIASNNPPTPTTSPTPPTSETTTSNLAAATHLHFTSPEPHTFPLDSPTRFISSDKPVDLRSIYFAWQKKDVEIRDYIASAQQLNDELGGADGAGAASKVQNLVFVERLDLITWLEGASDESEYIKALATDGSAAKSTRLASGAAGGVSTVPSGVAGGRPGRQIDPRLQEIYNLERKMGDRNSILRGIKPTVSHLCPSSQYSRLTIISLRISPTSANTPKHSSKTAKNPQIPAPLPPPQ